MLSPFLPDEDDVERSSRPIRSHQENINEMLDKLTKLVVVQLEGALRQRVTYLALDYIIDEENVPHLLWPHSCRTLETHKDGSLILTKAIPEPAAPPPEPEPEPEPEPTVPDWQREKQRQLEEEQARDAMFQKEYSALLNKTVGPGHRGQILICDPDYTSVVIATRILTAEGFGVTVVQDGPVAVQITRRSAFDCMLLGRDLPSMSGIEVSRLLRQREASMSAPRPGVVGSAAYHLPIVVFTNATDPNDLQLYMEAGIDGCVSKPVDPSALTSTMLTAVPNPIGVKMPTHNHEDLLQMTQDDGNMGTGPFADDVKINENIDNSADRTMKLSNSPDEAMLQTHGSTGVKGAMSMAAARKGRTTVLQSTSPTGKGGIRTMTTTSKSTLAPRTPQHGLTVKVAPDGTVHLPGGAAIPGVPPPLAASVTGGKSVAAGITTGLPVSEDPEDGSRLGVFQLDAETAIPYCVMGKKRPGIPLFHFVVINDFFDTFETHQIMFRRICAKLPGLQVLLFNYPGQAYTEWRRDVILNNEYLAGVMQALMTYIGPGGTGEFDLDGGVAPFHILGIGNGGAIAAYFAAAYNASHPNIRSITMINGFAHVDAHLAGVLHDCMNVFSCAPTSRPDLPVYFFARFLFSPTYLAKVGAPLALNLYTAVSNPITLQGRIALCQGALSHVDCRPALEALPIPMILVASSKDGLVKPSHVAVMVEARGGEVRSIKRALSDRARAVVVWLRAGHEVFQEARKPLVNLIEQLATGYHERNDVAFLPLVPDDVPENRTSKAMQIADESRGRAAGMAAQTSAIQMMNKANAAATAAVDPTATVLGGKSPAQMFEDKYIDNVISTMRNTAATARFKPNPADALESAHTGRNRAGASTALQDSDIPPALMRETDIPEDVLQYKPTSTLSNAANRKTMRGGATQNRIKDAQTITSSLMLDPTLTAFEKREKKRGKDNRDTAAADDVPYILPEVKEYMTWRVRRNQRRLQRIEACAVTIQRAWRAYLTRTLVARMRQQRAALDMQRWWRGCIGRRVALQRKRELWAVRVVQRYWRGFKGRAIGLRMKLERQAALKIQRMYRGFRARRFVRLVKELRSNAAIKIQAVWRRFMAQRNAWRMRDERNAVIDIQRVWRGYLGRARAIRERDRYLFSKSQAQGIEFGRQMLMEHKLHGTRLQSEVSLLTKEKLATEERVEALLAEIATFEQGVRTLEREMVNLSRAEAEAAGTLDEEAKIELRENKVRLDREFAAMLVKIADRRETLTSLETKLQQIDRARIAKREELKDLERKLVLLLEQQQSELQAIRMRQERRAENMVEDAVQAVNQVLTNRDPGAPEAKYLIGNGTTGGGAGATQGGLITDGRSGMMGSVLNQTSTVGNVTLSGTNGTAPGGPGTTLALQNSGGGSDSNGPTLQQRAEAQALMSSTETMMKFGFMSMSLTYFSSLNMVRAMRQMGTANTVLASNPMLSLIGQMGSAAAGGGNPAAVALAATSAATGGNLAITNGTGNLAGTANAASLGSFNTSLKPGALPGQEAPDVSIWTVGDVSYWLDSLSLGQYRDAFADAAVDGSFLIELSDEDLRNTLGIQHALHRKKILTSIQKLHQMELERKAALGRTQNNMLNTLSGALTGTTYNAMGAVPPGGLNGTQNTHYIPEGEVQQPLVENNTIYMPSGNELPLMGKEGSQTIGIADRANAAYSTVNNDPKLSVTSALQAKLENDEAEAADQAMLRDAGTVRFEEMMSWVRHNKGRLISEALAAIPDGKFDESLIKAQYVSGYGTQYVASLSGPAFHANKTDDKGNTLLTVAAQNGRARIVQTLLKKGANPNHQNHLGNTAMHYAMAYKFTDLAAWLADPQKGGADDTILNAKGLSCYDGLE